MQSTNGYRSECYLVFQLFFLRNEGLSIGENMAELLLKELVKRLVKRLLFWERQMRDDEEDLVVDLEDAAVEVGLEEVAAVVAVAAEWWWEEEDPQWANTVQDETEITVATSTSCKSLSSFFPQRSRKAIIGKIMKIQRPSIGSDHFGDASRYWYNRLFDLSLG